SHHAPPATATARAAARAAPTPKSKAYRKSVVSTEAPKVVMPAGAFCGCIHTSFGWLVHQCRGSIRHVIVWRPICRASSHENKDRLPLTTLYYGAWICPRAWPRLLDGASPRPLKGRNTGHVLPKLGRRNSGLWGSVHHHWRHPGMGRVEVSGFQRAVARDRRPRTIRYQQACRSRTTGATDTGV